MGKIRSNDKNTLPKMVSFTMVSSKFENRSGSMKIVPKTTECQLKSKLNVSGKYLTIL